MAFWLILLVVALLALAMVSSWRDPKNWVAHAESGTLRYTAWVELSIFGVMVAMVSLCSLLFIG